MAAINDGNLDVLLTALALVDAQIDRDNEAAAALLDEKQDATAIVGHLLWLVENLIGRTYAGDPHEAVDQFRQAALRKLS